ncbi:hypothetical protein [Myroides sp. DW712]|uniref:hypothetical protein n=1 Tax=Myroides sp. DW712 TaxID=3389800 RepID=UPI00397D6207
MEQQDKLEHGEFDDANLLDIKKATVSLLDTVGFFVFKLGAYIASKWMYLTLGLIIGIVLGYVKYNNYQKMLQTAEFSASNGQEEYAILLASKYKSIDYLNQLVEVKFSDKLGYKGIKTVKLEGVEDLFSFLRQDSLYPTIFTPLATKAESLNEAVHNYTVSKNYPYQMLKIKAEQPFDIDQFISDLQTHFNQHPYFAKRKQIEQTALAKEKEVLEAEWNGIKAYATLLEQKGSNNLSEQEKYLALLAKKRDILTRLNKVEVAELESKEVLFVVDYVTTNSILGKEESSITKTIAKDIIKIVLLFFVIGLIVDFVLYYKKRV